MADRATIARPYARAAFAHAHAGKELPAWSKLLGTAAVAAADPRVARLIGNPHVTGLQLVELLTEVAGGAAGKQGHNFLHALAENRRLALLPEIAAQFEVLPRRDRERRGRRGDRGARDCGAAAEAAGRSAQARLGREVRMHTRIDESLIGGAIIRAGDLVIDGSLKGRLARLARS